MPSIKSWKIWLAALLYAKNFTYLTRWVHLCQAYWQHSGAPVLCVVSESSSALYEVDEIIQKCLEQNVLTICLPDALYAALSQVENGVGLLFVVSTPSPQLPDDLQESAVVLDNLQDPGNLGSILRSAAAAGIRHIVCSSGTTFAWSPKVMRAGMGAHFLLSIYENVNLPEFLKLPIYRSWLPVRTLKKPFIRWI